ncbi:4Fe-4S dicluster domain-containing protein [bacterium]|nr:4Fe-4S dicluster domain-containing protein [bacterium]
MFSLPMVRRVFKQLFKKPVTNLFPSKYLPGSVTGFLKSVGEGTETINPPIAIPAGFRGKIAYKSEGCTGCGMCSRVCPSHAIDLYREEKRIVVFAVQCIQCGQCTEVCPKNLLSMTDEFLTATTNRYDQANVLE